MQRQNSCSLLYLYSRAKAEPKTGLEYFQAGNQTLRQQPELETLAIEILATLHSATLICELCLTAEEQRKPRSHNVLNLSIGRQTPSSSAGSFYGCVQSLTKIEMTDEQKMI